MGQEALTALERTDVARLVLMEEVKRRLQQGDARAVDDVREALDAVDSASWVSCLVWACRLAGEIEERGGA
jgi:hypothetical protein